MVQSEFGTFLTQLRKEKGLTQQQLADQLFITNKTVSRWECGVGFPDINQLLPISEILGISLVELLNARRMEEPSITIAAANDAVKSAFSFSEQEISNVRSKMRLKALFVFTTIGIILNLYFGQAFEWLLGTQFSFERPFFILYYLRHLVAAAALGVIDILCLLPYKQNLIRFSLFGCVLSVASTLVAIILWRITYGFELMSRIDYVCLAFFALSTVLLIIVSFQKRITGSIPLQLSLAFASFCVFCPVLFSMVLQNHAPIIESILKSVSLSSPMLFLAIYLRVHSCERLRPTSESLPE